MTTEGSNALQVVHDHRPSELQWTKEQTDLIKQTVAKGATDDELKLFLYVCKRTGLDPLIRQIHAVKRWSSQEQRETMAIQTGIDGYRLIAERTGKYAPGKEPAYVERDGKLYSATAFVKKVVDGTWHEVGATAIYEEYVQRKKDGGPTSFWQRMPYLMLAKCAEALALRRAFPAEMSGIYTHEEMGSETPTEVETPAPKPEAIPVTRDESEVLTSSFQISDPIPSRTKPGRFYRKAVDSEGASYFVHSDHVIADLNVAEGREVTVRLKKDGKWVSIAEVLS